MAIKNKVVLHNPTTKKHEPLASGDVLAGSIIQVSTDAGNSLQLGTDGGLKVEAVAQLPDDQVLTGDNSGSVKLTLTPSTQPNGDVNYTIKGEVKINPAVDNAAVVTEYGVYVPTPTVPTKQVEFGVVLDNPNPDVVITFTTPFPDDTVPFITLTPRGDGNAISDFFFDSLSNTGFTLKRGYLWSGSGSGNGRIVVTGSLQDIEWKAEEK